MIKIRLKRFGRKKQPSYRIITIDSRKKRDSKAIEELGFYNPLTKQGKFNIKLINKRLKQGAQMTPKVCYLINKIQTHD
uniref:ribosomal protein S16 n=1 Tax=Hypnea pseudomusciformis TaxID=1545697 RepID=UPI0027D9FBE9|nr:ribosomal protein S16 [Hypnea pseudomusciformis]WCH55226.1 ribosomal protein S16 [Hypnea pseudomusciformis]WCH55625.1 ribosomal protein S16 [Hypnea pseudomusciformis]WCH56819.1 ribosomal protein S16 [Hypnea pseudomusciformis]